MPDYLLPCTCGKKTVVSVAQAGETIRCVCGAELPVPSLRGLRAVEQAPGASSGSARRARARRWEDRHRAAFLLVVAALLCLVVASYLWATMPRAVVPPAPPQSAGDIRSAGEAFQIYADLGKGLPATPQQTAPDEKTRQQMLWGVALAVALAAAAGFGTIVVLLKRSGGRS